MKKILGIIVLGLLLSGNAYAGVNEPGIMSIAGCDIGLNSINSYLPFLIGFNNSFLTLYLYSPLL